MRFLTCLLIGSCSLSRLVLAQSEPVRPPSAATVHYEAELGSFVTSSGRTPFWLRANQFGTVPLQSAPFTGRFALYRTYAPADTSGRRKPFDWGAGVRVVGNTGPDGAVLLPEAYVKGRWQFLELYVGRRQEIFGLVDTLLSSGSYAWSGNALPIPKVQLGTPGFVNVPFTKGWLSFTGQYAHGWFGDNRLVTGSYLHQKSFYGRIGRPTSRVRFTAGFNHQVVWGGFSPFLNDQVSQGGRLPSNFRHYLYVVTGLRGRVDDPTITSFEWNRIGNHLGSLDAALELAFRGFRAMLYHQQPYDDGSPFYGTNLTDGLTGLRIQPRRTTEPARWHLRQLTLEHLYTRSQGGATFDLNDGRLRGRDNYFNHGQFIDGWTYRGRTIGTPFLTPAGETAATLDLPERLRRGIVNNRVQLLYLALNGVMAGTVNTTLRLGYSGNSGTYPAPFARELPQFSGALTLAVPVRWLGGSVLSGTVATDQGDLLPRTTGVFVAFRKAGALGRANPGRVPAGNRTPGRATPGRVPAGTPERGNRTPDRAQPDQQQRP